MNIYIMMAPSGAGKDTWIQKHKNTHHHLSHVVSADRFIELLNGEYAWTPELSREAHRLCLHSYVTFLIKGAKADHLYVSNTNTTMEHIAPYYRLAEAFGHNVTIVELVVTPHVAAERNLHGTSFEVITDQMDRIETLKSQMPKHWNLVRGDDICS